MKKKKTLFISRPIHSSHTSIHPIRPIRKQAPWVSKSTLSKARFKSIIYISQTTIKASVKTTISYSSPFGELNIFEMSKMTRIQRESKVSKHVSHTPTLIQNNILVLISGVLRSRMPVGINRTGLPFETKDARHPQYPTPQTRDPQPTPQPKKMGYWDPLVFQTGTLSTLPPQVFSVHILIPQYGLIYSKVDPYYNYPYFLVPKNVSVFQLSIFF